MSFKILHSFPVTIDREVEEVSTTQTPDGKEVTTKSKVIKPVQVTIVLKEPTRREKYDVQLFHSTSYSEAIKLNLLPKVSITQRLSLDPSASTIVEEDKALASTQARLQELTNDYLRMGSEVKTPEELATRERMESEWQMLKKKEIDITSAYESVFAHTAERYAQNKVLMWLTLFLSYFKTGPERYEPLFPGADFTTKEDKLGDLEDGGDKLYLASVQELSSSWMLWYFGHAVKNEDFVKIKETWRKEAEEAQKRRDEAAKAVLVDTPPVAPELPVEPPVEPPIPPPADGPATSS